MTQQYKNYTSSHALHFYILIITKNKPFIIYRLFNSRKDTYILENKRTLYTNHNIYIIAIEFLAIFYKHMQSALNLK